MPFIRIWGQKQGTLLFLVLCLSLGHFTDSRAAQKLALPSYAPTSGYQLQDAFPGLHFDQPVAIAAAPGETNRLFVVERLGRIMVITNLAAPTKSVFMDLRTSISSFFFEDGLLGLAFHPDFTRNGYFYVYRTQVTHSSAANYAYHDILARYSVSATNPNEGDVNSELRLITQLDAQVDHNAGTLQFGLDGYLYLSIGDDGPVGEDYAPNAAQNIDKGLFGVIIRIDVDKKEGNLLPNPHSSSSTNYYIPKDNPFIGATNYFGTAVDPHEVRTEIYALGLRNPWRFCIHPTTGAVVAGDVGGGFYERVVEIIAGGNYGWPYFEGPITLIQPPPGFVPQPTSILYPHGNGTNEGNCVIGGMFYFGNKLPGLRGKYIFGDFRRGQVWAVGYDLVDGLQSTRERLTAGTEIVAFAPDPRDQEVLAVNTLSGQIFRLTYIPPAQAPFFPRTLAETGAFADLKTLTPISDFVPYNVNVSFWSDNAIKERWFLRPPTNSISFSEEDNWSFPTGMVWMKNFEMELQPGNATTRKRLETRFIVKNNTGIYGVTYKWDSTGTNAILVPEEGMDELLTISEGGTNRTQVWHYPGRAECLSCHSALGGLAIGFNTPQLNCDIDYGTGAGRENQLQAFTRAGYFTNVNSMDEPATLRKLFQANDQSIPIYDRARSFMAANCQFCHQPGSLNARWDARLKTPLDEMGLLSQNLLVLPNSPGSSDTDVITRLSQRGSTQMPPLASTITDSKDIKLITDWIQGFPLAPWKNKDISPVAREGSTHFTTNTIELSGAGVGLTESSDTMQFLFRPASNNVTVSVKLSAQNAFSHMGSAGILLRANDSANATSALMALREAGVSDLTTKSGQSLQKISTNATTANWLQLRKIGDSISGWVSQDGMQWFRVGEFNVPLGDNFLMGLAGFSGKSNSVNLVSFEQFSAISVHLALALPDSIAIAGQPIDLIAIPTAINAKIVRVEYWADGELIGQSTTPFKFSWLIPTGGNHQLTAHAIDETGKTTVSDPVTLTVSPPTARVRFDGINRLTSGAWTGHYGASGHVISGESTNLHSPFHFSITNVTQSTWSIPPNDPRYLEQRIPGSTASWFGAPVTLHLDSSDGSLYKLSLYFVDWEHNNLAYQIQLQDEATGELLDTRALSSFDQGVYVQWSVRGAVKVIITGAGGIPAVLTGIFLDPAQNSAPIVQLRLPDSRLEPAAILPAPILFQADASDSDGKIEMVEFYSDGVKIGETTGPAPFTFSWTNALSGLHSIFARAIDDLGARADSSIRNVSPRLPTSSARLVNVDKQTHGNWIGKYGSEGYLIANHATNLPPAINIASSQNLDTTWAFPPFSETRALLTTNGIGRIGSSFYIPTYYTFSINVTPRDGENHLLSLYFLDWDRASWKFNLRIFSDANLLLDEREISNFEEGQYYSWMIKGSVRLEFTPTVSFAVVSGIFLDDAPAPAGQISIVTPPNKTNVLTTDEVLIQANLSGTSELPGDVQFFVNGSNIGSAPAQPYYTRWVPLQPGWYEITARMNMTNGTSLDSLPIQVLATNAPPAKAQAIFERIDPTTLGSWRGVYGIEGYSIWLDRTNLPSYLQLSYSGQQNYVWAYSSTEPRALIKSDLNIRAATGLYSAQSFDINIKSLNDDWHRLSLYCLDWDYGWRQQKISIIDPTDGSILNTQTLTDFYNGKYITWNIRGNVTVRLESIAGHAVVSGIFLDSVPAFQQWQFDHFPNVPPEQQQIMAESADPDGDGIPNLLEYKLGLNPLTPQDFPAFAGFQRKGEILLGVKVSPAAADVELGFESSDDLENWVPTQELFLNAFNPGQMYDSLEFEVSNPAQRKFYRLKATKSTP